MKTGVKEFVFSKRQKMFLYLQYQQQKESIFETDKNHRRNADYLYGLDNGAGTRIFGK
jgi:hypothetical protein